MGLMSPASFLRAFSLAWDRTEMGTVWLAKSSTNTQGSNIRLPTNALRLLNT